MWNEEAESIVLADMEAEVAAVGVAQRTRPAEHPSALLRRRFAPALTCAVAVLLTLVLAGNLRLGGQQPAYAATPDMLQIIAPVTTLNLPTDAPALLNEVARRTASLTDDSGSGRYARTDIEGWALWTSVDGKRVTSEVVPSRRITWTAADGSGRSIVTQQAQGTSQREDRNLAPGERSLLWPLGSLSADDDVLAEQLGRHHPTSNGAAGRLVAVGDAVAEQPLTPGVRAAVLRYLARTPGLTVDGVVADRAGRRGVALHVNTDMTGLPERRTLIVDPTSGHLLATEVALTETAGALNVLLPSVISYTTFRSVRYVSSAKSESATEAELSSL